MRYNRINNEMKQYRRLKGKVVRIKKQLVEQSGSFLNAPTAHPEECSDEGSQK